MKLVSALGAMALTAVFVLPASADSPVVSSGAAAPSASAAPLPVSAPLPPRRPVQAAARPRAVYASVRTTPRAAPDRKVEQRFFPLQRVAAIEPIWTRPGCSLLCRSPLILGIGF